MKQVYILVYTFLMASFSVFGQTSPVKWSFDIKKASADKAEFQATADISSGWNIYSVYMEDGGPIPTSFNFDKIENGKIEGNVIEKSQKITAFDNLFEMNVIKFKDKAEFTQAITNIESGFKVKGFVYYMCCDSQRCLPPTKAEFDLKL